MRATKRVLLAVLILPFLLSCVPENPQNPDFSSCDSENSAAVVSNVSDLAEPSEKDYSSCDFSVFLPTTYPEEYSPIGKLTINIVFGIYVYGVDWKDYKNVRFEFEGGEVEYSSYFENPDKHPLFDDASNGHAFCFRPISGGDNLKIRMVICSYSKEKTYPLQQRNKRAKIIQGERVYFSDDQMYLFDNTPVVMKTYEEYLSICQKYYTSAVAITESTFLFCHIILVARYRPIDVDETVFNGAMVDEDCLYLQFEDRSPTPDHVCMSRSWSAWLQIPKTAYKSAYLDYFPIRMD